jgi:hypothetical protein
VTLRKSALCYGICTYRQLHLGRSLRQSTRYLISPNSWRRSCDKTTSLSHALATARLLFEISTPECSGVSGRDSTLVFEPNFLTAILMCVARLLDLLYSPPPSPCCSCRRPALAPAAARATDKPPAVTRFSPGIPKSARGGSPLPRRWPTRLTPRPQRTQV